MAAKNDSRVCAALFAAWGRLVVLVLALGCTGLNGAWAQALTQITMGDSILQGPHPGNSFKIWNDCPNIGPATTTSAAQTINIPATAQQGELLNDWIEIISPGWSCHRYYLVGNESSSLPLPVCNGANQCWLDGHMTLLRHWLEGNIYPTIAEPAGSVLSDGQLYRVFKNPAWNGAHPMAGFGFIVKWSANVNGTLLSRPLTTDAPDPLDVFGLQEWGPSVETIVPSQDTFNHNDYLVSDVSAAFRLVLLAPDTDAIQSSIGNLFPITSLLRLGMDNCAEFVTWTAPCILSQNSSFTHVYSYHANVSIRHSMPTCTVDNVLVPLPDLTINQLSQAGDVAGLTPFMIELKNCASAFRHHVVYKLSAASSGPPSPDPGNGLVPLNPAESSASGVDVQILDQAQLPHPLDTFRTAYTWGGTGSPSVNTLQIPLYAQLIRSGSAPLVGGTYKAAARFVFQYQ